MENAKFNKELQEISYLKQRVDKSLKNAPQGSMKAQMLHGKYPQYYVIDNSDDNHMNKYPNGRYIRKEDIRIAKAYAQKEYDMLFLKEITAIERKLRNAASNGNIIDLKNILNKLPEAKRRLINPYILPDDAFLNAWNELTSGKINSYPIKDGFTTEKGELVRPKSEKMIADRFFIRGINYKYEYALNLGDGGVIFPDFTILNMRNRKEIYLEHFGMMDSPEYCKSALEKIEKYERNGIYQGERLLITYESSLKPINMKGLDSLIERYML